MSIDTGLSNGQTYYYQISAFNQIGEGPRCPVFSGTLASPPGPLLDLQAVASDSKVTLTWTAPSDNGGSPITGYIVYRSLQSGHETVLNPVTSAPYQDLNMVNGVTYYYRVSAVNAVGEGQLSAEVVSTPAAILGPPTSIVATASNSTIALSWTAPANTGGSAASSYKIYRGTSATTLLFLTSVTITGYQDVGLTNGQAYFYKISSVNSVGEGSQSGAVSATPFSVPTIPLSLSATGGNGGTSLAWAAPFSNGGASISRYHIYWSESATGPWTMIDTLSSGTVYGQSGLTNGHTYYYQVAAVNAAGEGPRTATVFAIPRTVPSSPLVSSAVGGTGNVTLVWTAPTSDGGSPLTKYSVYRGTSSGSESLLVDAGSALRFVDKTVLAGTTYYYRITASNAQGESLRSNEVSATTFGLPTAPNSLTGSASDSSISLQWTVPSSDGGSGISSYRVYYGTASGTYSGNQTVSSPTFVHTSLTNGVRYYYAVSAVTAVGEGPLSAEFSAVPMTNPTAPQSLLAVPGVKQITLSWMPPLQNGGSNVTGYKLYRGASAIGQSLIATLGPQLLFTDTGLLDGTTYHYSVVAINSKGESLPSSDASARTNAVPTVPTGFSANAGDSQVSLSWSAPADSGGSIITSYNVYRSTTAGVYLLIGNTASLFYTDPGLTNGQHYYYSVAAVNSVGEGARANQISTVPAAPPGAPTQLAAVPGVKSITLSWTAPSSTGGSPILGYHILRGTAPGSETQYADAGASPFSDSPLSNGATYYYKVVAYNTVNSGQSSNEASASAYSLPSIPAFLQTIVSDRAVTLRWSEPVTNGGSAVQYYSVSRGDSPSTMSVITTISSLSYADTGLTNGHLYYYNVSATNAVGQGPATAAVTATPSKTPSAPLSVSSIGGVGQVALSWSAPLDNGGASVSSYRLSRSSTEGGAYQTLVTIGSTSYTDTQLLNGEQYFYHVAALNSAGEGPYAATNCTTFPVPDAPVVQATVVGMEVQLSWTAPTGASAYRLYHGAAAGQESFQQSVIGNTFVDGPFVSGSTSFYYVTAVNSTGESAPSNEVRASIVTTPSSPTGLSAANAGSAAVLDWDAPSDNGGSAIQSYQVLRGPSHGTETVIGTSTGTRFNDTSVTAGQHYYYQVKAVNSAGTGPASNEAGLLYSYVPGPVLTVTAGLGRELLSWSQTATAGVSLPSSYDIFRSTASGSEAFLSVANGTQMMDTRVSIGQKYYYQVRAETATGTGPASNEANATPYTYPGMPTALVASASVTTVKINWSAPANDGFAPIIGYHVLRGTSADNLSQVATVIVPGYKDTGLIGGTTYYYSVTAYNAAGDGNATIPVAVRTTDQVDPPIGLTATAADGKITLMWNPPAGVNVLTYVIHRGNATGAEVNLTNWLGTSWVDSNVTGGQTYYYTVSALDRKGGESQMSAEASAMPAAAHALAAQGALLDQLWFRIILIMTILVVGFFSFIIFVRKGKVQVKRDK